MKIGAPGFYPGAPGSLTPFRSLPPTHRLSAQGARMISGVSLPTVMIRPLQAIQTVHAQMGRMLEAMKGQDAG